MPSNIYAPGMTIEQFRAQLQADPGFQQLVSSAQRLPSGQFTPQAGLAISRYAQSKGLNDLNIAQINSGDPHRSIYSVGGNGEILEQHDGKGPEFWGPIIVGALAGGAIAAPYLAGTAGAEGATAAGGTEAAAGGTAGTAGAGGAGAFDAAGNFIGGTTISSVAPAAGGSSLSTILGTAGKIGSAATALERGRAGGRFDEATMNQRQGALAQQGYSNDLAGARLNLAAPSERAHTSVQGDILANAKPFAFTGGTHMVGNIPVPNASGGLSPDLFSANTRALGTKMSADALADDSRLPYGAAIGPAPRPTPLPQASGVDSILSTAGIVGGLSDMFGGDFSTALSRYGKKAGTNGVS